MAEVKKFDSGYKPRNWIDPAAVNRYRQQKSTHPTVVIENKPLVSTIPAAPTEKKLLKVAAYCRVSTSLDCQETSIEGQKQYFDNLIRSNPDWTFAGIYLEAGLSGTKTESRPELQRLLADCKAGCIDLILTKSISRFARNTADCLEMVRTLTDLGVTITFEKEKINTGSMESEFMLSLLACFAEDESHSISGNMKWAIKKRFQEGSYIQSITPYGYTKSPDGNLIIDPVEAEIVKRIFGMCLSGTGADAIAKQLNTEHIPSPTGKKWSPNTIRTILGNPVYKGDVLYQKTYKDEHFNQKVNNGELDQYYDANHHSPIVSVENFDNAQSIIAQRAREVGYTQDDDNNRGQQRYVFSSVLQCAACGTTMHRQPRNSGSVSWICHRHVNKPDLCSMAPQSDEDIRRAFINCLNKLAWANKNSYIIIFDNNEAGLNNTENNGERLAEIERLLEKNAAEQRKLMAIVMRERFTPTTINKNSALKAEAERLTEERNKLLSTDEGGTIKELRSFVSNWKITADPTAFPDEMFTAMVEECVVNTQKMVTFKFKCGLKFTESLYRVEL